MSTFVPSTGAYLGSSALPTPFWRAHLLPVALGCALLALFSKINIPLEPVPISLQTVALMFIGLIYTRANAIQSVAAYLSLGALGLPVFASGIGVSMLIGPKGGYLLGFLAAVATMTLVRDKWLSKKTWLHQIVLCAIGTIIVFALGVSWLAYFIGMEKAIAFGIVPFILPSMIKIAILSSLLKLYQSAIAYKSK